MFIPIASCIMRTTIDLDATVLSELRNRSKQEGKSMGQLASELLAPALAAREDAPVVRVRLETWPAGPPRLDLEDKDRLWQALDEPSPADGRK